MFIFPGLVAIPLGSTKVVSKHSNMWVSTELLMSKPHVVK